MSGHLLHQQSTSAEETDDTTQRSVSPSLDDEEVDLIVDENSDKLETKIRLYLNATNLTARRQWSWLPLASPGRNNKPVFFATITTRTTDASAATSLGYQNARSLFSWGSTEHLAGPHPLWTQPVIMSHNFGSTQYFYVNVYQHHQGEEICLGSALFEVGDILGITHQCRSKRLPHQGGSVFCRIELVKVEHQYVTFQWAAHDIVLPSSKLRRSTGHEVPQSPTIKPRSFRRQYQHASMIEIARQTPSKAWRTVYRSHTVLPDDDGSYVWETATIDLGMLCENGGLDTPLRLRVTAEQTIGLCETTLRHILMKAQNDDGENPEIEQVPSSREFVLQRSMNKKKVVGCLRVCYAKIIGDTNQNEDSLADHLVLPDAKPVDFSELSPRQAPSLDIMMSLDICVAIDFTSSNGDPRVESSLHFQSDNVLNEYQEALTSISSALEASNGSKPLKYTVWGFGAKFGGDQQVRHLFQCGSSPEVTGLDEMLDAYRSVFVGGVTFSGPTMTDKVLQAAAMRAKRNHDARGTTYTLLVLLTNGVPSLTEVDRKLGVYEFLPLSMVVVGLGRTTDFSPLVEMCRTRPKAHFVKQESLDPGAVGHAALEPISAHVNQYLRTCK